MNVVLNTLIFLSVVIGSYYLMSIVQTVLHRDYGHRKRIKTVFDAHAIGHHGLYNPNNLQTEKFEDCESHALNYYGIPIVAFAIFIYLYFGPLIMFAHLTGVFVTFLKVSSPGSEGNAGCISSIIATPVTISRSLSSGSTT